MAREDKKYVKRLVCIGEHINTVLLLPLSLETYPLLNLSFNLRNLLYLVFRNSVEQVNALVKWKRAYQLPLILYLSSINCLIILSFITSPFVNNPPTTQVYSGSVYLWYHNNSVWNKSIVKAETLIPSASKLYERFVGWAHFSFTFFLHGLHNLQLPVDM